MKIFSWMQSKLTGKQGTKKENSTSANHHTRQDSSREEFRDWPHGLLAIGTFGNENLGGDVDTLNLQPSSQVQPQEINPEEVKELQKELSQLLDKQDELDPDNLQFDNIISRLENERSIKNAVWGESDDKSGCLQRSTSVVLNREMDIRADQMKNAIGKKSFSFLLKKISICRSGFAPAPTPSLRDPLLDKSRMEKILRALLHKKIYPQNSSPKATAKKYLQTSHFHDGDSDDKMLDMENDGSKWVKTDSEYIVLEM